VGAPIAFTIAGGEKKFAGQIYAFDPRIDTSTRTLLIRAVVPNPEGRLLPGAFASVEVVLGKLQDAVLIPAVAVVPGLNEKNVFVVKDGKAERRAVETGTRLESTVHILSGLEAGETVITSGLQQIRVGQSVSIIGEKAT
jgi:membrane fusion protein (multidrug efflux system)